MSNINVSLLSLQGLQVYDPLIKAWVQAQDSVIVDNLAPEFSTSTAYAADDYVTYQDVLYKFNAAHAAGAWVGTDADAIKVVDIVAGSGGDPDSFTQAQMTALLALLD